MIFSGLFLAFTAFLYATNEGNSIFLVITIALCLTTGLYVNGLMSGQRNYLKELNKLADEYAGRQMDCTYEFSDSGIYYSDKEKTMDLKWEVFQHFIAHKDYLIFARGDSFDSAYILSREKMEPQVCDKIIGIAAGKLKQATLGHH